MKRIKLFRYDPSRRDYEARYGFKRGKQRDKKRHERRGEGFVYREDYKPKVRPRPADWYFMQRLELICCPSLAPKIKWGIEHDLCEWLLEEHERRKRGKEFA